ncbi:hypothetical protein AX16_003529 [Volvariella volvacea WC 439]|nr:hypothetical protein AX16_003529 [Volvariella volvacea WC 439]
MDATPATPSPGADDQQPAETTPTTPKRGFIEKLRKFLVIFGGLYAAAVILLIIPFFQTHTIYLNAVKLPFFADFNAPEKYGLAPNKTLNFNLQTSDNETIGAWFMLSDSYYHSLPAVPQRDTLSEHITNAVRKRPTILFLHGNAATRAFSARIQHYTAFTGRLSANVLAIDYRGFGDSTGKPSEPGVVLDARTAWNWLIKQGARQEDIVIIGHSLGTGIASQLAAQFGREGINPRGIVLLSPFSSIRELLNTYHILGLVPLMKPLAMIPYGPSLLKWALIHKFDSLSAVPDIKASVIIAHATNDFDIPYTHSEVLFEAFLSPYLPQVNILPSSGMGVGQITKDEWETYTSQHVLRIQERKKISQHTDLGSFGTLDEFEEKDEDTGATKRKIVLVKVNAGKHDYIGVQEGVQDIIGRTFGLF